MTPHPSGDGPFTVGGGSRLVVARTRDGIMVKGHTRDFQPENAQFHVLPQGSIQCVPIAMTALKAVFFVRDLIGSKLHQKPREFPKFESRPDAGRRIAVVFEDGELLIGHAQAYAGDQPGFFVSPLDPDGNNSRVYVLRAATKEVRLGMGAEELARTTPPLGHAAAVRRRRILGSR